MSFEHKRECYLSDIQCFYLKLFTFQFQIWNVFPTYTFSKLVSTLYICILQHKIAINQSFPKTFNTDISDGKKICFMLE